MSVGAPKRPDMANVQERLRALTLELIWAEEKERRRISKGLHDDLGQTLAIAKFKIRELQELESSAESTRLFTEVLDLLDHTIQTMRSLTFELSSPILYTLGLEAALQQLGEQLERRKGIRFHFEANQLPKPLPDETSIVIYRIVSELVRNVERHSHARQLKMTVAQVHDQIHISVEDDGVGLDASSLAQNFCATDGFGLFSTREQLEHLGGRLEIKSAPGLGTRLVVVAPAQ